MEGQKTIYYQYQPQLDYQVYVKLDGSKLEGVLAETFETLGFSRVEEEALKDTPFQRFETKVLKIAEAHPKVARQIQGFGGGLEAYGPESLSHQSSYQLYRYQGAGMMVFSESSPAWELGLVRPSENLDKIKIMLTRFLCWALAPKGVVGFWAVPVEEGLVVMKPIESQYEAVFLDIEKMAMITQDGVKPIGAELQVLRLDETLRNESKVMGREALLSFMSANTAYFSHHGVSPAMRKSLYEIASFGQGLVYPVENFRPRGHHNDAA